MDILTLKKAQKYTDKKAQEIKLKTSQIEKELDNYQQTMAMVNINQEPTQQVVGAGVVSLPPNAANGQFSGVSLRGITEGTKSTIGACRLRSVGKNLFDEKLELGALGDATGLPYSATDRLRSINFIKVEPNTQYIISNDLGYSFVIHVYDQNKNWIQRLSGTISFITTENTKYIRFRSGTNQNNLNVKIQIEEGTVATPYEPYKESIQYISAKDENGNTVELRSNVDTKDEIIVNEQKLIKRVDSNGEVLATPTEMPIEVSGTLLSNPNGTVYVENAVADAGLYTDKITVLQQDLPIRELEKIAKVDFVTGQETELDITQSVIATDKLSFTHPDLADGDIVFFTYFYDRESTLGEVTLEYYDSRYTIKDTANEKFYQWKISSTNGTPSIALVEV